MNPLSLLLALSTAPMAALPQEVASFVVERDTCEHFRGEPIEGTSPEQFERRTFVQESLEVYCAGTDHRLAALKKRFAGNAAVMMALENYEEAIDGSACGTYQFVQAEIASFRQKHGIKSLPCFHLHYAFRLNSGGRSRPSFTLEFGKPT